MTNYNLYYELLEEKMDKLGKEYEEHLEKKPIRIKGKSNENLFYSTKLKKWEKQNYILHNAICDLAIQLLNKTTIKNKKDKTKQKQLLRS